MVKVVILAGPSGRTGPGLRVPPGTLFLAGCDASPVLLWWLLPPDGLRYPGCRSQASQAAQLHIVPVRCRP